MLKSMHKMGLLSLAATLSLSLVACGGTATKDATTSQKTKEKYPTSPINVIISYAAGGNTDVGARVLLPYVEKELGVPLNVVNKPGAGGWIGWAELLKAKPDGYTIGYINTPNLMTGYLDPKQKRTENLDSFALIANHVTDPGAIAIRKDEKRFTNIKELVEYAKKNEITTTSTGIAGDDHIAALKMNKKYDTKFVAVHNKGSAESQTDLMGGHVDVLFGNVGEVAPLNNTEMKVIGVMSEQRSPYLPDVPTLKESGYPDVNSWSARGLAAPKGIDPEKLEILRAAFEKGIKNADHAKKMGEMNLQVDFKDKETYIKSLKGEEKGVTDLKDLLGW